MLISPCTFQMVLKEVIIAHMHYGLERSQSLMICHTGH